MVKVMNQDGVVKEVELSLVGLYVGMGWTVVEEEKRERPLPRRPLMSSFRDEEK